MKEIFRLSNRKEAYLLPSLGIEKDISYKTVERLCSDPLLICSTTCSSVPKKKNIFRRCIR
ncbi:MAG: hypothetical protein QW578_07715, partial [Thermoplasmatales archaeon]